MKLKVAENSLFAILMRSPWWVSMLLALAITGVVALLAPDRYKVLGAFGALPFYGIGFVAAWRQRHAPAPAALAAQLEALCAMPWREFSNALTGAWATRGAQVQAITGLEADFCVTDLGRTVLVSARRWKAANHGTEAIEHLAGAMRKRELAIGQYLVGQGNISDTARSLAGRSGIEIIEGTALARLVMPQQK